MLLSTCQLHSKTVEEFVVAVRHGSENTSWEIHMVIRWFSDHLGEVQVKDGFHHQN